MYWILFTEAQIAGGNLPYYSILNEVVRAYPCVPRSGKTLVQNFTLVRHVCVLLHRSYFKLNPFIQPSYVDEANCFTIALYTSL